MKNFRSIDIERGFVELSSEQCTLVFQLEKCIEEKLEYILDRFKAKSLRRFLGEEEETFEIFYFFLYNKKNIINEYRYHGKNKRKKRFLSATNLPINATTNKIYSSIGFPGRFVFLFFFIFCIKFSKMNFLDQVAKERDLIQRDR